MENGMLTYRLYLNFKINKPYDSEKPLGLTIGSVEVSTKKKTFVLDFDEIRVYHDKNMPKDVITAEMRNPNYEDFPDCEQITLKDLKHIAAISDIYLSDKDLKVLKVTEAAFVLPYNDFMQIDVPAKALKHVNLCE